MTSWALDKIEIKPDSHIIDIGCGGGRTVKRLAKIADKGYVCGLDYSKLSVERSSAYNKSMIKKGRVSITNAGVSDMPFDDNSFDLATAFESIYFFPDIQNDIAEIYRVLNHNGKILICLEIYDDGTDNQQKTDVVKELDLNYFTTDGLKNILSACGFKNIKIYEEITKGWVCITGNKML